MPKIVELFKQLVLDHDKKKEEKPQHKVQTMQPVGGYVSNKKDRLRQLDEAGAIVSGGNPLPLKPKPKKKKEN